MNAFMTSRRLEALTHCWRVINKLSRRLNVLSQLSALGRWAKRIHRLEPLRSVTRPEHKRKTQRVKGLLRGLAFNELNSSM